MCLQPLTIKTAKVRMDGKYLVHVPCGKCPKCKKLKRDSWSFRLNHLHNKSLQSQFITFTYDPIHLPRTDSYVPTLCKRDIQLFFKKLRKAQKQIDDTPIKYYLVGEYGTRTNRPHYHALMFGVNPNININRVWGKGFTLSLPIKQGGIQYVLKYITKQPNKVNDALPEFSLSSKGIGEDYLTANIMQYHKQIQNSYLILENGVKMPIPKYYKEKLYSSSNGEREKVTVYLMNRYQKTEKQKHAQYMRQNPTHSVNTMLKNIDLQNYNNKFDKRIETL